MEEAAAEAAEEAREAEAGMKRQKIAEKMYE